MISSNGKGNAYEKLWIVLTLLLLSVSSAQAHTGHFGHRPFHPHFGAHAYVPPHYRPHYPHRYYTPLPEVLAGIVGTTVGSYFIGSQYQPSHDSSTYCFTLISDNGKKSVERCVHLENGWSRDDVYRVLYID